MNMIKITLAMTAGLILGAVPWTDVAATESTGGHPALVEAAYLGVATEPVDATLGSQLGLPPHIGLVVRYVDPASPAAGVLHEHDVLEKIDDQLLVSHYQFSVLVRTREAGEKVTLTVIREGERRPIDVVLTAKPLPSLRHRGRSGLPHFRAIGSEFWHTVTNFPPFRRVDAEELRSRIREWQAPAVPGAGRDGLSQRDTLNVEDGVRHTVTMADDEHTLKLSCCEDGSEILVVTDSDENVVFEGPVDTAEQRAGLPEEVQAKLRRLSAMGKQIRTGIQTPASDADVQ